MSGNRKDARMEIVSSLQRIFQKYNKNASKDAFKSLASAEGKREIEKLIANPRKSINLFRNMSFREWLEQRTLGRSLPEANPDRYAPTSKATIYRAIEGVNGKFNEMDYITLSRKFAKDHAKHNADMNGEPSVVLEARVPAGQVFEASNPGEYFYNGQSVEGKVIYTANPSY